ncbi:MAG: TetR/AcrR family transcriptional regulator [Trebonia sp.]
MSDTTDLDTSHAALRHEHGWPEKRQAILRAARMVFTRDGFARANVADVAAEAGVSKRTLYKHYGSKESLFIAVVEDTLTTLSDQFRETSDRHLDDVTDIEASLVSFGREWVTSFLLSPDVVAMRRLHAAEGRYFPALNEVWREAGPELIQRILEQHLRRLHDRGLLAIPDAGLAAEHLAALILYTPHNRALYDETPIPEGVIDRYVSNGIHAFLTIYRRPDA